jgi:periplasmic protein TonB
MNYTSSSAYMSPSLKSQPKRATSHLSIRPVGEGTDIRELFSDQPTSGTRVFSGTVVHIAALALLLLVAQFIPDKVYETILPQRNMDLVYLVDPGPGGGGGGGNKSPDPPKKLESPKAEAPKPVPIPEPVPVPVPTEPQLTMPVQTLAAVDIAAPGDISANAVPNSASRGSGTGTGAGPGTGSGLGPGRGGGFGGGVYNIGNGVTSPVVVFKPSPKYTADAMRAKVQGTVILSAVVLPDGSVTDISIVRSLDQSFGLDEEAKKNAAQWRFRPGMFKGEPVAVRIQIELDFNLR